MWGSEAWNSETCPTLPTVWRLLKVRVMFMMCNLVSSPDEKESGRVVQVFLFKIVTTEKNRANLVQSDGLCCASNCVTFFFKLNVFFSFDFIHFGFHFHFSCKDRAARHHGATVREGDVILIAHRFIAYKVISFMFIKSSARTLAVHCRLP